ncbi:hypothetical protein J6590_020800 [Homalodisca vitripennis]|nr:hypothetical protein J6590_020800 [Homalodisca vitripennis]
MIYKIILLNGDYCYSLVTVIALGTCESPRLQASNEDLYRPSTGSRKAPVLWLRYNRWRLQGSGSTLPLVIDQHLFLNNFPPASPRLKPLAARFPPVSSLRRLRLISSKILHKTPGLGFAGHSNNALGQKEHGDSRRQGDGGVQEGFLSWPARGRKALASSRCQATVAPGQQTRKLADRALIMIQCIYNLTTQLTECLLTDTITQKTRTIGDPRATQAGRRAGTGPASPAPGVMGSWRLQAPVVPTACNTAISQTCNTGLDNYPSIE